ncbi:MAG TPA: serine/threonine-protein kinase, partial [Phycisphaerales bacterium]|nr:serine/threonine-protein kinase [Phycisphaerales bacterium]
KVFDAGATETGRPYFVMELVRGLPITEYCDARKLGIRERLALVADVCDALQHAHQKGVIHRDIKPSNVLVSEIADRPIVKIIDFGVAKATTARLTEKTVYTEFRQMIGTPEYMSPEQAGHGAEDVDTRTDVYSAGVLLYELLTGATPFDSQRLRSAAYGEIQRIIREEDPPRPSTRITSKPETLGAVAQMRSTPPAKLPGAIRGDLDWIVMKAMDKERARRYDSAGDMSRDIQRFLAGEAVQAAPPGRAYVARKFVRRHRGAVLASGLLLLVLVAGLVGTSLGFFNSEWQRGIAVAEKKRADQKADEALAAEAAASRHAYSASMLSACQAMALNQPSVARGFLDGAPANLRGWEWRVLDSRLDTSVRSLPCAMSGWKAAEDNWAYELIPHPDGRSFFTIRAFEIDAAQRWDAATGNLLARYPRPASSVPSTVSPTRCVLASDGSRLCMFCGRPRSIGAPGVELWNLDTNSSIMRAAVSNVPPGEGLLAVSPDGARVVRCPDRGGLLTLQDVRTGAALATAPRGKASWGVFSPDGKLLVYTDERGNLQLVHGDTLLPVATLGGHKNALHSIVFSADDRFLATASIDTTARIWDLSAEPPSCVVLQHPGQVETVALSADSSIAATMGGDLAIRVWDARTGDMLGLYSTDRLVRGAVMVMPDGRSVAGRERDGTVRFWDITADSTVNLRGHKGYINAALLAEKPGIIVSAAWDGWHGAPGCVRFWDAPTGQEIASIGEPGEVAYTLAVSPDGRCAVASLTRTPGPWTPAPEEGSCRLIIVDLRTAAVRVVPLERINGEHERAYATVFDATGEYFAVGRGGRIEIRRASDGAIVRIRTDGIAPFLRCIAWSPDGRTIACFASSNPSGAIGQREPVLILNADTLATERSFDASSPFCIVFSRDSRTLLSGARDGIVRAYNAATGAQIGAFQAHDRLVSGIAPSPDGTRLATVGGDEGDVIVWDTTTPPPYERVARFHEDGFVGGAVWDSTGTRLIGACDKTIRIWDDTPLRERVAMRQARAAALKTVEPLV